MAIRALKILTAGARRGRIALAVLVALGATSCAKSCGGCTAANVRLTRNPYARVDWAHDQRLKTQLHEHIRDNPDFLKRMDDAGYNAVALMHYSGVASRDYPWRERHWPPERFVPAEVLATLKNIKVFFPNAEEVGFQHLLSPFLTTYIAKWQKSLYPRREPWHYDSMQEAIDLIRKYGGLPFIAHPWKKPAYYAKLRNFTGMELYNAYCRQKFQTHQQARDKNENLMRSWDRVLLDNPAVVGIAVNDWFGPWNPEPGISPDVRDSGKIIVFAKRATLADLRKGLESGAVLAIKDLGSVKGQFPQLHAIHADQTSIRIELAPKPAAKVRWIADGKPLSRAGPELPLTAIARGTHYVRAEIIGADGSTVYTQAFGFGAP
jgi:hypothetical protein